MAEAAAIVTAVGGVVAAVTGGFYKLWKEHSKLTSKTIDVIERNAISHEKLVGAISKLETSTDRNSQATVASADITRQTKDTLSQLMLEVIKKK